MGDPVKKEAVLKRLVLLFSVASLMLVFGSGMALAEELVGTEGPDRLLGTVGDDSVSGLGSGDFVTGDPDRFGPGGNDAVSGDEGDDQVYGTGGDDRVFGGSGNDDIAGTTGSDVVYGDDGDDKVSGGYPFDLSSDSIFGGAGNDIMDAYNTVAVADFVSCGTGDDLAYVDESDVVSDDCEAVVIGPEPDSDDLQFLTAP